MVAGKNSSTSLGAAWRFGSWHMMRPVRVTWLKRGCTRQHDDDNDDDDDDDDDTDDDADDGWWWWWCSRVSCEHRRSFLIHLVST